MGIPVYRVITDHLLQAINAGTLKPGDRIASIRELSAEYHVSQITVLRVFKELARTGKIVRRDGLGYYVKGAEKDARTGSTLILACRSPRKVSENDNFINRLSEGLVNKALEEGFNLYFPRTIYTLRGHAVDDNHMKNLLQDIQKVNHPAGIILDMLYPDEMIRKHLLGALNGLPCVIAGRRSELPVKTVSIPFEQCADDAALLALRSNAQEFFIYEHNNPWGGNHILCRRFQENLIRNGIAPERIHYRDRVMFLAKRDTELLCELEEKIPNSPHKILVFSSTDYFSKLVMERLHRSCAFGTRHSLISFGGFELMRKNNPPVTSIVPNARQIGVLAVELTLKNEVPPYTGNSVVDYKVELNGTL